MSDVHEDELLTLEEAAALLKVPKSWIYERTRKGAIPHVKLGKYLRFPRFDLLQWINTQKRSAGQGTVAVLHTRRSRFSPDDH
jgi:excisionase family DNA binding protein